MRGGWCRESRDGDETRIGGSGSSYCGWLSPERKKGKGKEAERSLTKLLLQLQMAHDHSQADGTGDRALSDLLPARMYVQYSGENNEEKIKKGNSFRHSLDLTQLDSPSLVIVPPSLQYTLWTFILITPTDTRSRGDVLYSITQMLCGLPSR